MAGDVYFSIQCPKAVAKVKKILNSKQSKSYTSIHNGYIDGALITEVSPQIMTRGGYGRIKTSNTIYSGTWNKDFSECTDCAGTKVFSRI